MQHLLENVALAYVADAIAAANNTDSDSAAVDTQGYEGVLFVTPITDSVDGGVATATAMQCDTSNGTFAALSGAAATVTSADDDDLNGKLLVVDVYKPRERYLKLNLTSATQNIAFGATVAIAYGARRLPITQDTDEVAASTLAVSPAEA